MSNETKVTKVHTFLGYCGKGWDCCEGRQHLLPAAEARREEYLAGAGGAAHEAKVVVIGDAGVGKTSLLQRVLHGSFTMNYQVTIGIDFAFLNYDVFGAPLRLVAWDTAGQEKFRGTTKNFYTGAEAVVLFYDTNNPETFSSLFTHWLPELEHAFDRTKIPFFLVGNKSDLASFVDEEEAAALAKHHKLEWYTASVKDDFLNGSAGGAQRTQVKALFERIACVLTERLIVRDDPKEKAAAAEASHGPRVQLPKRQAQQGGGVAQAANKVRSKCCA